jgi:hypothetical protein
MIPLLEVFDLIFFLALFLVCVGDVGMPKWKDPIADPSGNERYWRYRGRAEICFVIIIVVGYGLFIIALTNNWLP